MWLLVLLVPGRADNGAVNFSYTQTPGIYTVMAENVSNGCNSAMTGQTTLVKSPTPFQLLANGQVPQGVVCPGKTIGLNGSETGVTYILELPDGNTLQVSGNGSAINFPGEFSQTGTYRIFAENEPPTIACRIAMSGHVTISTPDSYALTPLGGLHFCDGDDEAIEIRLQGSEPGVFYQLYKNDQVVVGDRKEGTGQPLLWTGLSRYGEGNYIVKAYYESDPSCLFPMGPAIEIFRSTNQVSVDHVPPFCRGESTVLTASAAGGTYIWYDNNGVQAGSNAALPVSPVETTQYTVVNTNQYGCTAEAIAEVVVRQLPEVELLASGPATFCDGETLEITAAVQGGQPSFGFAWYEGGSPIDGAASVSTYQARESGSFSVFVTDQHNCSSWSDVLEVTVLEVPLQEITTGGPTAFCAGEALTLTAVNTSEVSTFSWQRNGAAVTGANAFEYLATEGGSYSVEVMYNNGCVAVSEPVLLTMHGLPSASISMEGSATICEGATLHLQGVVHGGKPTYSYEWFEATNPDLVLGSGSSLQVGEAGSYIFRVTDDNQCSNHSLPQQVVVLEVPELLISASGNTTICKGESLNISTSNANILQYKWHVDGQPVPGQTSSGIKVTQPGTYSLEVVYTNRCTTVSEGIEVIVNDLPHAYAGEDTTICFGEEVILTASSDRSEVVYEWSHGRANGQAFAPAATGMRVYEVTVRDTQTGCIAKDQVNVFVHSLPNVDAGDDVAVCLGAQVTLRARGENMDFSWNHGITNGVPFVPRTTATYVVTATDRTTMCTASDQLSLVVHPLPTARASAERPFICKGDTIRLTATGGEVYSWDNNAGNTSEVEVSPDQETIYTVTVRDENGCVASDQVTVQVYPLLRAGDDQYVCDGDVVVLRASGGINYHWSHGVINGQPFTPTQTRTYIVTTTDIHGCTGTDEVEVIVYPLPIATATADREEVCIGEKVTLTGEGGLHYSWSHEVEQGVPFAPATTTTYTVWAYDSNNCSSYDQITIEVNPLPEVEVSHPGTITCQDPVVVLHAVTEAPSVVWSDGNTNRSITVNRPGTYSVTAVSMHGCMSTASASVDQDVDYPVVEILGNAMLDCHQTMVELFAEVDGGDPSSYSFVWSTGGQRQSLRVTQPGQYHVDVTAPNGCTTREDVYVEQDVGIRDPFVPNALRPMSDIAENRLFKPDFYCPPYNYSLQVFNRYGKRVFSTSNPHEGWNGRTEGKDAPGGVYVYQINYDDSMGFQQEISGTLKLLR